MDGATVRMLADMLEALGRESGTLVLACRSGRWRVTVTRGAAAGPEAHQGPRGEAPALRDALPAPHAWLCPAPPAAGPAASGDPAEPAPGSG